MPEASRHTVPARDNAMSADRVARAVDFMSIGAEATISEG
jgi:hypothetical protein